MPLNVLGLGTVPRGVTRATRVPACQLVVGLPEAGSIDAAFWRAPASALAATLARSGGIEARSGSDALRCEHVRLNSRGDGDHGSGL